MDGGRAVSGVDVLRVPYDSGHRGARMGAGPLRLLDAGLVDRLTAAGHEARVVPVETGPGFTAEVAAAFELAGAVRDAVDAARSAGRFPLLLAGNCFASVGAIVGLGYPELFWFDAHGDLNTPETTRSGFLDGMALSVLLGRCWQGMADGLGLRPMAEEQVWLLGARDLDAAERELLAASGIREVGPGQIDRLDGARGPTAFVHVDLDALDPRVGRANHFAASGGFTVADLQEAVDRIAGRSVVVGAALTAYDPDADPEGAIATAALRIAEHVLSVA